MEFISERVSVDRQGDDLSVVITARLPRWQEALLVTWMIAWLICGAFYARETALMPSGEKRSFYLLLMLGWGWIAFRIGRVMLWRTKGFELVRLKEGRLTLKNSIFGYGKARDHFVENIQRFGPLEIDERSWAWQLNDSFWVMGGERLGFEHLGRRVVFGKGLDRHEAERIASVLDAALKRSRKKAQ